MSHAYHLVCLDSGEVLDLGKFVCLDENGNRVPWRADGWRDQETGERLRGEELGMLIEHFLIRNRGREIRVLPEPLLQKLDPDGVLTYLDSRAQILELPVGPEPDIDLDTGQISPDTVKRLAELVRSRTSP